MADHNTAGRQANAAEALGEFTALGGKKAVEETGKRAQSKAGPDGGDAVAVGATFKKGPKQNRPGG